MLRPAALIIAALGTISFPAHGIILPRGTTALFNGGASSFDAFAATLKSFGSAVSYATLPCYTLRGVNPATVNLTQQAAFCVPFYNKVKANNKDGVYVYSQPSIAMGGNYAYQEWGYAEQFAKAFVAEALKHGWDGYWIDMEISAHTKPAQVEAGIKFLNTVGAAMHSNGLRLAIEEKSTFLNAAPTRKLITNGTVDAVVLWYYQGEGLEERFMGEAHSYFGAKAGLMCEPSPAWTHDAVTAKKLMCKALQFGLNEVSYWTNLGHMNASAWAPAIRAYVTGNHTFCAEERI